MKSIHIDSFIAEIKSSFKQYDTAALIDDTSITDWVYKALRRFGNLITTKQETLITVENGRAWLPRNFDSLDLAIKVDKSHIHTDLSTDVLQKALFWKERVEKIDSWNVCADCEKEYSEKTIVEKIYYSDRTVNLHYKNPTILKLKRHTSKDSYTRNCKNIYAESPYEISIQGNILHTSQNFPDGEIFIRYYGFETDEEGKLYIPESPQERLETYLTYHVKRKILEDAWLNGDDENLQNKIQYTLNQENAEFSLALTDIKASTLTLGGFKNIERLNKRRTRVFEIPML